VLGGWALVGQWDGSSSLSAHWTLPSVPQPQSTAAQPLTQLDGISCSAATACVTVGQFLDGQSDQRGLVEGLAKGAWSIQSSTDPAGNLTTDLNSVSCDPSGATCLSVGRYVSRSSAFAFQTAWPIVEQWTGSAWTLTKAQPTRPSGAVSASLSGVSCSSTTSCTAVGVETAVTGHTTPFAEHWDGTGWKQQTMVDPSPGDEFTEFGSISCTAGTSVCVAVGSYLAPATSRQSPFVERFNGSTWGQQDAPLPNGLSRGWLLSVSCPTTSWCLAGGSADDSGTGSEQPLVETLASGAWHGSVASVLGYMTDAGLSSVSCTAAHSCQAVGSWDQYINGSYADAGALGATLAGSTWTPALIPSAAGQPYGLDALSCTPAGSCAAVGWQRVYSSSQNQYIDRSLLLIGSGGTWTADQHTMPAGGLSAVSCTGSSITCLAVGPGPLAERYG
jgi:hypothetical protein